MPRLPSLSSMQGLAPAACACTRTIHSLGGSRPKTSACWKRNGRQNSRCMLVLAPAQWADRPSHNASSVLRMNAWTHTHCETQAAGVQQPQQLAHDIKACAACLLPVKGAISSGNAPP